MLLLIMAMLQSCASSTEYIPEGADRMWLLDSVMIDRDALVESESGTYYTDAGASRIMTGPEGATLTLIGNREGEEETGVFHLPVTTIQRIWYETVLYLYLKDETERMLQPGEWCMEVERGRFVSVYARAGHTRSGDGEYTFDTQADRFYPPDIESLEVPITGWQVLGNIVIGIIIAIPSWFVLLLLANAGVFNFSF